MDIHEEDARTCSGSI